MGEDQPDNDKDSKKNNNTPNEGKKKKKKKEKKVHHHSEQEIQAMRDKIEDERKRLKVPINTIISWPVSFSRKRSIVSSFPKLEPPNTIQNHCTT